MSELYSLPDGWEWKKLDDFVSIKGGKRIPKGKKLLETKTNYPYIRVTDFNDFGSIDLNNIQYITEEYSTFKKTQKDICGFLPMREWTAIMAKK
jgi:restriction endonuclease S subunit